MSTGGNAIAPTCKAKLKYFEQIQLNPVATNDQVVSAVYRCNDCYDPAFTGVGH